MAATLTGCGGAAQAAPVQDIDFWHLLSGGDGIKMQAMINAANQANPGFMVHPTVLAWGPPYYTKLAMASAGGRPPEVAIMHASRVPGYAPGGLIEPWDLDLLAENGVTAADFAPRIWEKSQQDGKVFSIALDSHPFIMFYNTDVAAKAGVLGSNGQLGEVSSPQEFKAMALEMQKVTKAHGLSFGYLGSGSQMWRLFYTLYKQHGADMELTPGQPMKVDRDAAIESLEFMASLFDDTIAAQAGDISTGIAEFARGSSGMLFSGVWELPTMKKAGIPVDAATIPTLYGTPASCLLCGLALVRPPAAVEPQRGQTEGRLQIRHRRPQGIFVLGGSGAHPRIPAGGPVTGLPRSHSADPLRQRGGHHCLRPRGLVQRLRLGLADLLRGERAERTSGKGQGSCRLGCL